jgi:hypothetical protein
MERFIVTVTYPQGAANLSSDLSGTSFDMPVKADSIESAQAKAERMAQALAAHLNDPSVGVQVSVREG